MSKVLVTGGSGFIGSHCILKLLSAGHEVQTTLRSRDRVSELCVSLRRAGGDPDQRLSFFVADLTKDEGWPQAVAGCDFALHVASPFPAHLPQNEDELIVPAREGTLRVLRAARDAGVKRVVLTSSFAAIGYGREVKQGAYTEADWSDPDSPGLTAYAKSKTLAERAAWNFIASEGGALELSVVNPVVVFGPVLSGDYATSIMIVQRLMDGAVPGLPRLWFGVVDVRDVADLHLRAMTHPEAKGERFLAVSGDFPSLQEIAGFLKKGMGPAAGRVPTREFPNWMVKLAALRDPAVKQILPELGKLKNASSEKAQRVLGWQPRSREEAVLATAQSLIHLGLLKNSRVKK